jgi:cation transport regulator ChaB
MPRSSRYGRGGKLPGTVQRSSPQAQALFTEAYENAVQSYGEGDRALRAAYEALKQKFEKRGDHWIPKPDPSA